MDRIRKNLEILEANGIYDVDYITFDGKFGVNVTQNNDGNVFGLDGQIIDEGIVAYVRKTSVDYSDSTSIQGVYHDSTYMIGKNIFGISFKSDITAVREENRDRCRDLICQLLREGKIGREIENVTGLKIDFSSSKVKKK